MDGDTIERRPALSADSSERVAVMALLGLKNQSTLALERDSPRSANRRLV
jgi:hypothetical protein